MFTKDKLKNVHSSSICNSPKLQTTQLSTDSRLWYIHTMQYYIAVVFIKVILPLLPFTQRLARLGDIFDVTTMMA